MSVKTIITEPNKILRQISKPVKKTEERGYTFKMKLDI